MAVPATRWLAKAKMLVFFPRRQFYVFEFLPQKHLHFFHLNLCKVSWRWVKSKKTKITKVHHLNNYGRYPDYT